MKNRFLQPLSLALLIFLAITSCAEEELNTAPNPSDEMQQLSMFLNNTGCDIKTSIFDLPTRALSNGTVEDSRFFVGIRDSHLFVCKYIYSETEGYIVTNEWESAQTWSETDPYTLVSRRLSRNHSTFFSIDKDRAVLTLSYENVNCLTCGSESFILGKDNKFVYLADSQDILNWYGDTFIAHYIIDRNNFDSSTSNCYDYDGNPIFAGVDSRIISQVAQNTLICPTEQTGLTWYSSSNNNKDFTINACKRDILQARTNVWEIDYPLQSSKEANLSCTWHVEGSDLVISALLTFIDRTTEEKIVRINLQNGQIN